MLSLGLGGLDAGAWLLLVYAGTVVTIEVVVGSVFNVLLV